MARIVDENARAEDRKRILEVAGALFRQAGFYGTSMRTIAQKLRVTAPFIYYHFATKRDLYYACLKQRVLDLEVAITPAFVEGTPIVKVAALIESIGRWQIQNHDIGSSVLTGMDDDKGAGMHISAAQRKSVTGMQRRYFGGLRDLIEEGRKAGDFRVDNSTVATFAALAIGDHVPRWYRPGGRLTIEQVIYSNVRYTLRFLGVDDQTIDEVLTARQQRPHTVAKKTTGSGKRKRLASGPGTSRPTTIKARPRGR